MMKKNFLKLAAISLGVAILVSSCLKTEELDSVKAMREAKVDDMKASTALKNADLQIKLAEAAADRIKNAFDSVDNAYTLQQAALNTRFQEANTKIKENEANKDAATVANEIAKLAEQLKIDLKDLQLKLDQKNAEIANQALKSQESLSLAKVNLMNQQISELQKQVLLDDEKAKDPTQKRILADYNAYYNGGTVSSGITITAGKGIYGLKTDIMNFQSSILSKMRDQDDNINDNAYDSIGYLEDIRSIKEDIEKEKVLISIYSEAKNSQDYQTAFTSLVSMANKAYADVLAKEVAAEAAQAKVDTAYRIYVLASDAYDNNVDKKDNAEGDMEDILDDYSVQTLEGLNTKLTGYNKTLADKDIAIATAQADLNDINNQYSIYKSKYELLLSKLNTAANAKNTAEVAMQRAQYIVDTANYAAPFATTAMNDDLTAKTTTYNNAVTAYNDINAEYTTAYNNYTTAQTALIGAQNALDNAQDSKKTTLTTVETLTADIKEYNELKVIFDAAVAADAALLATKNAKLAQYNTLDEQNDAAADALQYAIDYNNTVINSRDIMADLIEDKSNANLAIDAQIASFNYNIAEYELDIDYYELQIKHIGDDDFKLADEIKELETKIAYNQELVKVYESKATALKALIDKF